MSFENSPVPDSPSSIQTPESDIHRDNGLRLQVMPDGLEKIWDYEKGGHHPVRVEDCLGDREQYRVIHKLGNGGYANVWLCRDIEADATRYVAVKILMADVSGGDCPEQLVFELQELAKMNPPLEKYICLPIERFEINGPNGIHLCIVYPVEGPPIVPLQKLVNNPNKTLRSLIRQAVEAMAALHRVGVCHGDFRPPNILLRSEGLTGMAEDDVLDYLQFPETAAVVTDSGEASTDPGAPLYLVYPVEYFPANTTKTSNQICVIDFGEAFKASDPPETLGIPMPYAAPETLFQERPSPASDIWALACTIFEIRTGARLLDTFDGDKDDYLSYIVDLFGRLPEPWWSSWEGRQCCFPDVPDPNSTWVPKTLSGELGKAIQHLNWREGDGNDDEFEEFFIPEDERELFADLLETMFCYDVGKRPSAEEVLKHPWFEYEAERA